MKTPALPPALLSLSILVPVLAGGCNSGLEKYDEDPGYLEDLSDDYDGYEVQEISDEDCATICLAVVNSMPDLLEGDDACTYECGVDIGLSFDGSAEASVLFGALEAGVDGEFQSGGSCDMVLNCGSECQVLAQECMAANPTNPEFVEACMEEYRQCHIDTVCEATQLECIESADEFLVVCLDEGGTAEDCWDTYNGLIAECTCIYIECVDGGDPTNCTEAQPASLPYSPAPGRIAVPEPFFDAATDRLPGIAREVFLIPRVDADGLFGIELRSLVEGDTLSLLGLNNGDIFRGIDGYTAAQLLDSPSLGVSAVSDGKFDVLIHRGQQSRVVQYRVVP